MASSMLSSVANGVASATYTVGAAPVILAGIVAVVGVFALTLKAVGFTADGPAAGSYAAAWMSSTAIANGGTVAPGSLYSAVQAAAMGGGVLLRAPAVLTVLTGVAVAVAGHAVWKAWF